MARIRLDTAIDLHSPSTIASNRGYSMHVYLSAVRVDGVDLELIIITSTDNGPLLPDGSHVRAVGLAVRVGDVVLARNPTLTVCPATGLVAAVGDLTVSRDSDTTSGSKPVILPEPLEIADDLEITNLIRDWEPFRFEIL